jgi:hypothetical protein
MGRTYRIPAASPIWDCIETFIHVVVVRVVVCRFLQKKKGLLRRACMPESGAFWGWGSNRPPFRRALPWMLASCRPFRNEFQLRRKRPHLHIIVLPPDGIACDTLRLDGTLSQLPRNLSRSLSTSQIFCGGRELPRCPSVLVCPRWSHWRGPRMAPKGRHRVERNDRRIGMNYIVSSATNGAKRAT